MIDVAFYTERALPALNEGLLWSISLIIPSAIFGLLIGIVTGTIRAAGPMWLRKIGDLYAALFRGTPLVMQLMFIYYGLPNFGIYLEPYWAAVTGFMLCSGAYNSEYIRGALLSIKRGQVLAAQALGFSTFRTMTCIIIPQALRRALPGCGNEIIYLIKYSSLAYVVTFMELTGEAKNLATRSFRFTEVFLAVGMYYLFLVTIATWILHKVEKMSYIPGFTVKKD
ncbi:MAG: amino acid ABC transporter permease [Desulfovibrio sp.]